MLECRAYDLESFDDSLKMLSEIEVDEYFTLNVAQIIESLKYSLLGADDEEWDEAYDKILDELMDNPGIERLLGSGSFSSAFLGYDGFVYKANIVARKFDPWLAYAEACYEHQGNPFLPEIYQIDHVGKTYCAKMERLDHKISSICLSELESGILRSPIECWDGVDGSYLRGCSNDHKIELSEIIKGIYTSSPGVSLDIHDENIMFRSNGQVVITDPLAFGRTIQKYRGRGARVIDVNFNFDRKVNHRGRFSQMFPEVSRELG